VERKKKPASDIVKYTRDALMSFSQVREHTEEKEWGAAPQALVGRSRTSSRSTPFLLTRHTQENKVAPPILAAIPEIAVDPATVDEAGGVAAALAAAVGGAPGGEERDWRARTEGGSGGGGGGSRPATPGPPGGGTDGAPAPPSSTSPSKIVKASDLGRTAWAPAAAEEGGGGSVAQPESAAAALKAVKGILNKLTPDNFDRLSTQLARLVTSPFILRGTIACLFENAVAQPTFVSLYANLCDVLAAAVPEFPADSDDRAATAASEPGKPIAFRRILLNTCQEEFEGGAAAAAAARAEGSGSASGPTAADAGEGAAAAAARRTKLRTLGTMRLIAELYVKGVIQERIVHVCLQSLLSTPGSESKDVPPEDALSAVCEVLTVAGKKLEAGGGGGKGASGAPTALASYFTSLERLAKAQALPPRARFMVRDVLDLRRSDWVPRRAGLTAKKLEDVRAEARAELGMVAVPDLVLPALAASLPALPSGSLASAGPGGPGAGDGAEEEEADLFPAFKGGDDGWAAVGAQLSTATIQDETVSSALVGAYTPVPEAAAKAPSTSNAAAAGAGGEAASAAGAPAPSAAPAKSYTPDQRASLAKSVYSDYLASRDAGDAGAAAAELLAGAPPAFGADLVRAGLARMFEEPDSAVSSSIAALVASLAAGGLPGLPPSAAPLAVAHPSALREGLAKSVGGLEDLALDVPKAPGLLGGLLGAALGAGLGPGAPPTPALSLADLTSLVAPIESAEPRRALIAATLKAAAAALGGVDKLAAAASAAGWAAGPTLVFDVEFDGEMEGAAEFLAGAGLGAVPV